MADELGACPDCTVTEDGRGWHLCPVHRADSSPRSLNVPAHLARCRAELEAARARHPTALRRR